ncbi:SdhA [Legionella longbeachae]|uniref:SdhA n=1 Tax=Legionella longbeachae TaxID=450 RepID=UPI001249263B|nr:SdhA [Legionella longbeachae]QEY50529.1 SdhA [Legionella longbeachae]
MIEEYIKLLESFKRNQISKLLERIDTKLFEILYSKHVSPRLIPFFPRYELCFMTDETKLEPGKLYVRENQGKITYSVIAPNGETIEDAVLEEPASPSPFKYKLALMSDMVTPQKGFFYVRMLNEGFEYTVIDPNGKTVTGLIKKEELKVNPNSNLSFENLESLMPEIINLTAKKKHTHPFVLTALKPNILSAVARKGHIQWAPFTDYSLDPDNISQIKKLINALYHGRRTFIDLENADVRNKPYTDLKSLWNKTVDSAYEASYLLTHLDVDLTDMFSEELAVILPLFSQIQGFTENHAEEQQAIVDALQPKPLAYNAGKVAGITVDQLRPLDGDVDYNFLTQFSAVLPSYIDKLTQHIQQFSSQIKESEPKLNKEKLDELQNAALHLLNDLESLKGGSVFVSLKFLNYIHIIRNIITLSMSSLEQIGELSDSSQDLVRDKLAYLKYSLIPTLFGLVDKIEDNAMLKPGTLSVPLMEKVKVLYEAILYLPKKAVDFKTKGAELLEIEDPRFIESRLEMSYKRIDKANKALYKIQKAREACSQFFEILNDPRYTNVRIYQFPPEVKKELIKNYKLISPYMSKLDIDFNTLIIEKLDAEKEDWNSYLKKPWRLLRGQYPADHIRFVLEKQKAVEDLIIKAENSQLFHINLNKDLIESVHKNTKLFLFPYSEKENVYSLDESGPLQIEKDINKKFKLTKAEFQRVQNAYIRFAQIVKRQIAAQPELENNLALNKLESTLQNECQRLYNVFQPYLCAFTTYQYQDAAKSLEQHLSDFFTKKTNTDAPTTKLFLNLDKNIQEFFNQINYEWSNKSELQQAQSAYIRFSQLIKKQIDVKPELYGNSLLLTNLDEETKKQCQNFYQTFKPYFKFLVSSDLKDSAQNFEQYLVDLFANKPLDILDAPATSLFLKLDKEILAFFEKSKEKKDKEFFTKWKDKSEFYYDFSKKSFLSEEESKNLQIKREQDAKLHFKKEESNKILQNPEQLSADQALDMWQWYRNKYNKFLVVRNAYAQFLELIRPQLSGKKLLLENLDPQVKEQCRNLYSIFQSYLLGAVPVENKEAALEFDKYIVDSLSNRKLSNKDKPSIHTFRDLDRHFQVFFSRTHRKWQTRAQTYYDLAQEKFILENEHNDLDPKANKRAHYVISHTNYSKAIHEFRASLFEITKLFNKAMRAELRPQNAGVPFPEMENDNRRLAQSKQVCALKDIFNSMYHLEGIVLELEKLNNNSAKSLYVYYLLQAYGHVNEIIKLTQRLVADPHLGFIARELQDKAQNLYATIQEQSDAYQVGPEQVRYGSPTVQYNALWYVLNAFYIGPKHIRALNNTNYLTTEELDDLHIRAKKATLFIENLIKSSDSYFKLFLQTPNMIYLYQELTQKLNEFTTTSHDAVLNNINQMQSAVFTPMLLEADLWENRLGLEPGKLSEPLRQITNEFFKGLLHPFGLDSKTHLSLVCDQEPLSKRTVLTNNQIKSAKKYLKNIENEYKDIEDLYQCYLLYHDPESILPSEEETKRNKENLRIAYQKARPKIVKLIQDKKINIEPSNYPEDLALDELCNSGLKTHLNPPTQVEALIKASHHYYLGLKATHEMRLATAEEKLTYLTDLVGVQEKENTAFVEQYTTESFDKHYTLYCNRHIGLQYTDKEYQAKLEKYLLNFRNEIIAESKTANDINLNIQKRLKEKISLFEKRHYAEYYHLDSVRVALAQFKNYFSYSTVQIQKNNSLFESETTLNQKSKCIKELEDIAETPHLEVKERLDLIKNKVKNPNFERIILNHRQTNTFSFNFLKICFLSLLEALHLYTPTRKKLLDGVNNAVHHPPEISELTKRFGLFVSAPTKDVTKKYEAPTLITAPTA